MGSQFSGRNLSCRITASAPKRAGPRYLNWPACNYRIWSVLIVIFSTIWNSIVQTALHRTVDEISAAGQPSSFAWNNLSLTNAAWRSLLHRFVTIVVYAVLVFTSTLFSGCAGNAASQVVSSPPSEIGDVRGDGPPRSVDPDRLELTDQVPRQLAPSTTGNAPYVLNGRTFTPLKSGTGYVATGVASWYGKKFHGRKTSSGEPYDMYAMTAAHRILPLPSFVRVTNLASGQQAILKVNDRGPFRNDRLIDLSYAAAVKLGATVRGTINVRVEVVSPLSEARGSRQAVSTAEENLSPDSESTDSASAVAKSLISVTNQVNDYRLFVQAGAFLDESNAERYRQQLLRAGLSPVQIAPHSHDGDLIYRVRIGPMANQRFAREQQIMLNTHFNASGRLVFQRDGIVSP